EANPAPAKPMSAPMPAMRQAPELQQDAEGSGPVSAALWRQASTAWFAGSDQATTAALPGSDEPVPVAERPAALAGLAVALGLCWVRPPHEPEQERRPTHGRR